LIVISEGSMYDQAGLAYFSFGQNGHYRDSVAVAPPLIHALSLDKVMDLSSNAIPGVDLAGGTMYDTSQTNDGWSDSGAQSTEISPRGQHCSPRDPGAPQRLKNSAGTHQPSP
jgi:hypothetical protein